MRTGAHYLNSLRDRRQVVIDGALVNDVTTHPAFAGICRTMAGFYDHIAAHPQEMTFPSPADGRPVLVSHMAPRSANDEPNAAYSAGFQPTPTPNDTRPAES